MTSTSESDSFVSISFPIWTDRWVAGNDPTNDGSKVTNLIKINIKEGNLNSFVGFFVPRCTPFMANGNNEIKVVGT